MTDCGVTCPECGSFSTRAEITAASARPPCFRWWVVPAFLVPGALLVLLQHLTATVVFDEPAIRVMIFAVLYPMAFFALRDHRGPQRGGVALVLTVFLWLTNSLMTAAYPVAAVA
ncbi:MAG: hypothetical protein ACYS0D_10100 [Planctomycetota bacterium]